MTWLIALFLLAFAGPLAAQQAAQTVVIHQGLDPDSGAVVGQHVTLRIDVLFSGQMPRPPRVTIPDVPGLQVIRIETQGTTIRESIGGEAYVGQRFEFALYPRRGGMFDIPPADVSLLDKAGDPTGHINGESLRLDITVPAGVDIAQPVVATSQLRLDEQWTPAPTKALQAGDAIVRTITRSAEDVLGLALADLPMTAPEGVRVYADPPDIEDRSNRGSVTGHRIDRITYVFEHGGHFRLPVVKQPWWDLETHSLKIASASAVTVNVAAVPEPPSADARTVMSMKHLAWLSGLAVLLLVFAIVLHRLLILRQARQSDPQHQAFNALRHACTGNDPRAIYRAFSGWANYLEPSQGVAAGDAAMRLRTTLFAGHADNWIQADSSQLLARLNAIRSGATRRDITAELPPLNPVHSLRSGGG